MFETTRRHVYLAGFMGTGKSVVGPALARRLNWGFIDLDQFIESMCHRTVGEIFRAEGEEAFRNYESRALRLAVISPHSVIALGGGTPLRNANANIIRATGRTWLLTASWETIWERVRADIGRRPLLARSTDPGQEYPLSFERFLELAEPLYQARITAYEAIATDTIDTSDDSAERIASRVAEQFRAQAG